MNANLLKVARVKAEMTIKELSEKIKMKRNSIYCYEAGTRIMRLDTFIDFANATDMTDEEIIKLLRS